LLTILFLIIVNTNSLPIASALAIRVASNTKSALSLVGIEPAEQQVATALNFVAIEKYKIPASARSVHYQTSNRTCGNSSWIVLAVNNREAAHEKRRFIPVGVKNC